MNLFDIAAQYRADCEKLASLDVDEQTFNDTLESLSGDLEVKATNIAALTCNLEATAAAIKDAETQMAARRRIVEAKADRLRAYVLQGMQLAGVQKIETPFFALSIKQNPPSVVINEAGLIPAEFMRQPEPPPPAPDKKAIGEALKAGREVPGAHLQRGQRLEIR
jgi:hypothetical protein